MQPAVYSTLSKEISSVKEKDLNTLTYIAIAEDIISCLKTMEDIATMLCMESEPTLSVVKPILTQLLGSLPKNNASDSATVQEMKAILKTDIESRYEKQSNLLNLALLLILGLKPYHSCLNYQSLKCIQLTAEAAKFTRINLPKVKTEPGNEQNSQPVAPPLPALPSLEEEMPVAGLESVPLSVEKDEAKAVKLEVVETKSVLQEFLGDVYFVKAEPAKTP